ncbi:uncharacterized protein MELLADRAFT_104091 [Melampsora larici-populina 98AG31]|uniref:Uncharacterized protein n=1 Tax=Melampsora larici-populina (strain 98AG31 / pathotype 3-4-7) TaxID=747676 RepID=F4RDJ0_MELLP|nr:uncharacterized protein MELLADRAFT_104091 [Melampsora larici-populina 98AG31]EGG09600.1 hypothetical protein MELLADRAFT_104091 [Melampsora larici-populina 98AG31]
MSSPMMNSTDGRIPVQQDDMDRVDMSFQQQAQRLAELENAVGQQTHQHERITNELDDPETTNEPMDLAVVDIPPEDNPVWDESVTELRKWHKEYKQIIVDTTEIGDKRYRIAKEAEWTFMKLANRDHYNYANTAKAMEHETEYNLTQKKKIYNLNEYRERILQALYKMQNAPSDPIDVQNNKKVFEEKYQEWKQHLLEKYKNKPRCCESCRLFGCEDSPEPETNIDERAKSAPKEPTEVLILPAHDPDGKNALYFTDLENIINEEDQDIPQSNVHLIKDTANHQKSSFKNQRDTSTVYGGAGCLKMGAMGHSMTLKEIFILDPTYKSRQSSHFKNSAKIVPKKF